MFVFNGSTAVVGEGLTLHSVGLLWTSDQPYVETYAWQYTKLTKEASVHPAGFEPAIPASEGPLAHTLDRAATGIRRSVLIKVILLHKTHLRLCDLNCYPQTVTSFRRLRGHVLCSLSCLYVHHYLRGPKSVFRSLSYNAVSISDGIVCFRRSSPGCPGPPHPRGF
jgi:hypothetical protein